MIDFESLKFGDVFFMENGEYIFLTLTDEDAMYVAKILDPEISMQVHLFCNKEYGKTDKNHLKDRLLCCYIKLTTESLKDKVASLIDSGSGKTSYKLRTSGIKLNEQDKKSLKEEIVDPNVPLPGELKDLIGELKI